MLLRSINEKLKGMPDRWITIGLFLVAAAAVYLALRADPAVKALALAWLLAP
jgi:hypothetical protein